MPEGLHGSSRQLETAQTLIFNLLHNGAAETMTMLDPESIQRVAFEFACEDLENMTQKPGESSAYSLRIIEPSSESNTIQLR
jgi:hypothetical protein